MVTEVGGGLPACCATTAPTWSAPTPRTEVRPRFSGVLLAPWPNRVADGAYEFDGESHQLPLTEPERGNALHGLVTWDRFELGTAPSRR